MLIIKAGRLIDGEGQLLQQMAVLVREEKITQVAAAKDVHIPGDATVIDATDATVMPGMIDAHLHVMGSGNPNGKPWAMESVGSTAFNSYVNAKKDLEAGFTAIRDAGNQAYVDVALRDAIDSGLLEGPRMKVAGQALASTGGHMDRGKGFAPHVTVNDQTNVADSPDEGRKATRYQIKMGADFIKISATLSEYVRKAGGLCSQELTFDTMRAICEVAHATRRKVAAHCHGGDGVKDAILAGVDTLEHGRFLSDELLGMMAERGVYLVPTLSPEGRAMERGRDELNHSDSDWDWFQKANTAMYDTVARAHKTGVKVASGSDAAMPYVRHGENAYELELLVRAGLTNMEAVVAATKIGAEVLGVEDQLGTIKAGKLADLLVIDGDPLADITLLQDLSRIKMVIKGGKIVIDRA